MRVLVATASLELGIDIGTVDLAVPDQFAAGDCGGTAARGRGRDTGGERFRRDDSSLPRAMT